MLSLVMCADETFHNVNSELMKLPAVELSTLPLILKVQKDALALSDFIVSHKFLIVFLVHFSAIEYGVTFIGLLWLHLDIGGI